MERTMFEAMLLQRVEQLESKNRGSRWLLSLTFTLAALFGSLAVADVLGMRTVPGRVVQAEKFILTDEKGVSRLEMVHENGVTMMSFLSEFGEPRLAVADSNGEPGVHIYDQMGYRRAALGMSNNGPSMVFMTRLGVHKAGLITQEDGSTAIFTRPLETPEGERSELKFISLDQLHDETSPAAFSDLVTN